ncbi:hypothetical protein KUCAC02_031177, partial [Chaenocephalus aceratus]
SPERDDDLHTLHHALAESSNKHRPTPAPRKFCNITHLISRAIICLIRLPTAACVISHTAFSPVYPTL